MSRITFQKRQKEMKRLEKRREKEERRAQRKLEKTMGSETPAPDQSGGDEIQTEIQAEENAVTTASEKA